MLKQIITTIDRIEGDFAILKHKNHEILWAIEDLPEGAKEGSIITLTAMNDKQAEKSRTEMAKEILNDILNTTIGAPGTPPATKEEHETLEEDRLEAINKSLEELNENLKKNE